MKARQQEGSAGSRPFFLKQDKDDNTEVFLESGKGIRYNKNQLKSGLIDRKEYNELKKRYQHNMEGKNNA